MRSLGVVGFSVPKRVGNLAARASGVRSRLVLVVDCVGLVARSVAPLGSFDGFGGAFSTAGSVSLAESIMLSASSSTSSSMFSWSSPSSLSVS